MSGRTAVITGGNSGIGFEAARVLAVRGARLILGCRDQGKARDAVTLIRATAPAPTSGWCRSTLLPWSPCVRRPPRSGPRASASTC
jgi:NAD(P)-dependent dehydrogenase (short-subunit alcohol dehydrogenase family)